MGADPLDGMTQEKWDKLTIGEKRKLTAPAYPAQLTQYLGTRVEVEDRYGERRRFWVGRSTGWRPCFLEIKTRRSSGGSACDRDGYISVKVVDRGPR